MWVNLIKLTVKVDFLLLQEMWTVEESLFPVANDMASLTRSHSRQQRRGVLVCLSHMTLAEWVASEYTCIFWLCQNIFPVAIWTLFKFSQRVWQVISLDSRARTWCSPKCCQFGYQGCQGWRVLPSSPAGRLPCQASLKYFLLVLPVLVNRLRQVRIINP